jgi:tetratricopeptide (TPR) repeat protein
MGTTNCMNIKKRLGIWTGRLVRGLLLQSLLFAGGIAMPRLEAAVPTEEEIAYNAAARFFQDKAYDRAAAELDSYVKRYPTSDRVPDALLAEAQARFELRQYDSVISLMATNFNRAAKRDDYFRFWIAESYYRKGDYASAATNYHQLLQDYPLTFLQAQASYSEAMSWFQAGNVTNAIDHLRQPGTPFQKAAQAQTNDLFVLRGYLLLGEALMQEKEYRPAEEALNTIANRSLPPELAWQRQYLLVRVQLADQRSQDGLKNLANLLTVATNTGSAKNLAQSLLLQGQVLQAAQQLPAAIEVYDKSLPALPPDERR